MKRKAFALIFSLIVIVVLIVLSIAMLARSISERRSVNRHLQQAQAFWAAEAGVSKILNDLRNNYNLSGEQTIGSLSLGDDKKVEYQATIAKDVPNFGDRTVTVHGYFPTKAEWESQHGVKRTIEVVMRKAIPEHFYDNAIYSAGDVTLNGNAFSISAYDADGDGNPDATEPAVLYADNANIGHPENIIGITLQDATISPLARLDFQELYNISFNQGNVYDQARIDSDDSFPDLFWYSTDDINENGQVDEGENWIPNVVYVETDLKLKGGIGTIAGFFVVVGDVITNPGGTYDATINGNGQIEGVIYTRGDFRVNGGGGADLNINGGIWAGGEVRFNGGVNVAYNADYMGAIANLNIAFTAQIFSWQDLPNPYTL